MPKPNNGDGDSGMISLAFDLGDELERTAYEMAKKLARPHGRRKHVIVALLYALNLYEERTGTELNTDMVMAMALSGSLLGGLHVPVSSERPQVLQKPTIAVTSASKASMEGMTQNWLASAGSLFD